MTVTLTTTTLVVAEQDEAIRFYTEKLGFEKKADSPWGDGLRWVSVAPESNEEMEIVFQIPDWFEDEEADRKSAMIGHQPTLGFNVDDCHTTYATLSGRGVEFTAAPEDKPWGTQAVAHDLYGNSLVFIEPTAEAESGNGEEYQPSFEDSQQEDRYK